MKILILYASHSGNTESIALHAKDMLIDSGHQARLMDVSRDNELNLCGEDHIIFGCSTHGDGELNAEAEAFFDKLRAENADLDKVRAAIFGLGESVYPDFCRAAELAKDEFEFLNARVISPILKIDMMDFDQVKRTRDLSAWLDEVCRAFCMEADPDVWHSPTGAM